MELIDKIQRQLDANHYVEAEDIQKLINEYKWLLEYINKLEKESPNDYTNT